MFFTMHVDFLFLLFLLLSLTGYGIYETNISGYGTFATKRAVGTLLVMGQPQSRWAT